MIVVLLHLRRCLNGSERVDGGEGGCDHGTIVVSFWVSACCCIAFATLSKEKFLFLEAGRFMVDYSGAGAFVSVCSLECTAGGLTDVFGPGIDGGEGVCDH